MGFLRHPGRTLGLLVYLVVVLWSADPWLARNAHPGAADARARSIYKTAAHAVPPIVHASAELPRAILLDRILLAFTVLPFGWLGVCLARDRVPAHRGERAPGTIVVLLLVLACALTFRPGPREEFALEGPRHVALAIGVLLAVGFALQRVNPEASHRLLRRTMLAGPVLWFGGMLIGTGATVSLTHSSEPIIYTPAWAYALNILFAPVLVPMLAPPGKAAR